MTLSRSERWEQRGIQSTTKHWRSPLYSTGNADLRATDFSDDRLSILLRRLSDDKTWVAIEQALSRQILRVYDLRPETVRLNATTVNGNNRSRFKEPLE